MDRPRRRSPRARSLCVSGLLFVALSPLLSACRAPAGTDNLQHENFQLQEQITRQTNQLAEQATTIAQMRRQLSAARGVHPDDLKKVFVPVEITIERLSGGYDDDGKPGDDGVVLYVAPRDKVGDILKVAGSFRIELYDLAAPPDANLLSTCEFSVDEASKNWYGMLATYHYALRCPWERVPRSAEITARITFIDYLTQRVMTVQRVVSVKLRP